MSSIGIERVNYIALNARDPEAAAKFATERLGFNLVQADADGSHYLSAHGVDRYSLVYKPGDQHGLHHVSYLVHDGQALDAAARRLEVAGVAVSKHDQAEWEGAPAIRFHTPAGHLLEFTTGTSTEIPVAHLVEAPESGGPEPVVADHLGLGAADFQAEEEFMLNTLGQLCSARTYGPDGVQVMGFLRAPGRYLYHDVVLVQTPQTALHHIQFSLKNVDSFYSTAAALQDNDVKIEWGPLRHGPGHNIAMYFRDAEGYWFEYSVEEEIILHDPTYVPRSWTIEDPHVVNEWDPNDSPPAALLGPPPADALLGADLDVTFAVNDS
ncbi:MULTISPECIES: VOC family protein [unclassified Mycobacterium]|uniref:VOC family protein n=1 Tax=unclassified Mycobacterium TaxID=2642494 RepID=UPI0029C8A979|nr:MULTISPECIES: VOC family protein [unclassified Mycobacterium]